MSVLTTSGGTSSQEVAEIINRQAKTTWPAVCGGPESVMMFAVPTIQSQPQSQSQSRSRSLAIAFAVLLVVSLHASAALHLATCALCCTCNGGHMSQFWTSGNVLKLPPPPALADRHCLTSIFF
jgi:hypothetical protein